MLCSVRVVYSPSMYAARVWVMYAGIKPDISIVWIAMQSSCQNSNIYYVSASSARGHVLSVERCFIYTASYVLRLELFDGHSTECRGTCCICIATPMRLSLPARIQHCWLDTLSPGMCQPFYCLQGLSAMHAGLVLLKWLFGCPTAVGISWALGWELSIFSRLTCMLACDMQHISSMQHIT